MNAAFLFVEKLQRIVKWPKLNHADTPLFTGCRAMTTPTIHMNGTSSEALLDQYEKAYFALHAAYDALKLTAPNGRDYYTQGPSAMVAATYEHIARLRKVDDVIQELSALMVAISEQ